MSMYSFDTTNWKVLCPTSSKPAALSMAIKCLISPQNSSILHLRNPRSPSRTNSTAQYFLRKKITPITIFMSIKQMGKLLALNQRVWRTFDLSTATKQADGRERPTYTYSNVQNWSRRIECGLFKLDNLYIPINHQNVHWLTMRVNFKAREISLWDSAGMNLA